jgi:FkbM family methyltransferase
MQLFTTLSYIANHPLNRKRKMKAILNFFKWQIGSRLIPGEVIFSWINGSKIIARPGESSATGNIYCGLYTFSEMAYVLHSLTPEDLFIDIGSNIGCFTILACAVKGAKGYCFEPIPSTYNRLLNNLQLNNLTDRVKAFNIGLSDKEGTLSFTTDNNTTNRVVKERKPDSDEVMVKVMTLDKILIEESPTILKIDVEGYETPVLNGSLSVLKKESLNSVIIRQKGHGSRYGYDEKDIFVLMKSLGFNLYSYDPFKRRLEISEGVNPQTGNALFIRNASLVNHKISKAQKIYVSGISL